MIAHTFTVASEATREGLIRFLREVPLERALAVHVEEAYERRTLQQNRELWALCTFYAEQVPLPDPETGELRWFRSAAWKERFRELYIEPCDLRLPDGQVIFDRPRTSELSRSAFDAFLWKIRLDAADRGLTLPGKYDY